MYDDMSNYSQSVLLILNQVITWLPGHVARKPKRCGVMRMNYFEDYTDVTECTSFVFIRGFGLYFHNGH